VWIIYLVAVLYGISFTVSGGAFAGLIKELVPGDLLGAANGAFGSVRQLLRLVGPLAGAGLFAAIGGYAVVLADIASFLLAATALAGIRVAENTPVHEERRWLREVGAGVRHLVADAPVRRATLAIGVGMLALGAVDTVVFAFVDHGLHKPPTFLSILITVQGIGALAGAMSGATAMRRLGETTVIAIALAAFGIAIAVNVVASVPLALASIPLTGVGNALGFVAFSTLWQRRTPGPLVGRVSAATDVVIGGAQTLSMAAGATLIGFVDYRIMFAVIGVALLACAAVLAWASHRDPVAEPTGTQPGTATEPGPPAIVPAAAPIAESAA
jgi:Transmembrane secretion effector